MHTEISSDTHHSVNTDDKSYITHEIQATKATLSACCDSASPPTTASPPGPPPTTRPEIDEAQSQDDYGCLSTFIDKQY